MGCKMKKYNDDFINGQYVSPLVVTDDYTLTGEHNGSVYVESGEFLLLGTLNGSLSIENEAVAKIAGKQQGSVFINSGADVTLQGKISGSTFIQNGATLVIEESGRLNGSLQNNGTVILRGIFGGSRFGSGDFIIEDTGRIEKPIIKDGISYYYHNN